MVGAAKAVTNKKAPGSVRIRNIAVKLLTPKGVAVLVAIFNELPHLGYFSTEWKNADVIVLPNSGKDPKCPEN